MGIFRFHQYQVVGRALPTEKDEHPKIFRMKLWATNEVRAKSKFWYFLRKLKKVKKSNGQVLAINEIFEKNPTKIKNYGIWLRYQSRTGYHNMYKEYRDTTLNGGVEQMYTEMASRHRVRFPCIQIIKTATIPAKLCKRESTKQFHKKDIKFPLRFVCLKLFWVVPMAQDIAFPDDQVVIAEKVNHVRLITLNRPRQLNVISAKVVCLLADYLEKYEKDNNAELGVGRAFSAGGDLKMFYDGRNSYDSCLEVVYRMYWLCYHNHTYKKTQVALAHGIVIGGGASLMVPMKFSVVTEKTNLLNLEKRLLELNSGDVHAVKSVIQEFSSDVIPDDGSILHKQAIIDKCFSKESVKEIIQSFEAEASNTGNDWILAVLKGLKRSSPTGLNITFRSGIRALTIDKDNSPKWSPETLDEVTDDKVDLVFQPFEEELELHIPNTEASRWDGKFEHSAYPSLRAQTN
ncbi:hypothetical protein IFM89_015174 [Coptis chinensis]|uniref:60S ribosomal protein L18a n=1 Tax=Coptis chinensis TaxID=261450 RepID=A0A835GZ07_9MAGN|nr:hypothetical protein IFM89_015174 [Coptis chinensis]